MSPEFCTDPEMYNAYSEARRIREEMDEDMADYAYDKWASDNEGEE